MGMTCLPRRCEPWIRVRASLCTVHPQQAMEVEVKLRLPSAEAHQRVADLLSPYHKVHHLQHNFFFDGSRGELREQKAVFRLRFYGADDSRCVASLKGKATIVDGISTGSEEEEEVSDVAMARACVADPSKLSSSAFLGCKLIRNAFNDLNVQEFVCLGGFRNVRNVYEWEGLVIELDETQFDFGTAYEIECETSNPEKARSALEAFLSHNNIPFTYSSVSKFAVFRSGSLPP